MNDDIDYDDIDPSLQQYESCLNEAKDERDAIQKKTFTKWVNKHLIKVTKGVVDLFEDLRDGHNLISLLEVLSGEILPRERGRMRVHMLQNIQICLNFLKRRKIKLVNIRPDDIVDGNPKLTLGLIWTIILHFQLSDIVLHDDTQSFKEALLRWAQKTTEGYPGVKVTDFTQSWRDGLAFNAILHRNRPDLLDYRSCRGRTARENLENAFHIADRDLGVTRLLDAEDVDTPNPDEKSLITYISSLYELFPEPPEHNPLLDLERIRRIDEYKELASRLCVWMRESISRLRERNFPNTLDELKILQRENNRFRTEEIPPKLHDKQRLASSYKDIVKMVKALPGGHHRIEEEYKIENIEHQWNKLITAHQERDHAINEEVNRLEKLHRLAEKLLRDIKQCDVRLDDIERQIVEEEKRVQRLHPLETKFNVEKIEADLRQEEERIKNMFKDVQILREGRYHKATELHNRVQQLHQRWADMKLEFQTRVVQALADRRAEALKKPLTEEELIASNPSFKFLHECIVWVQEKLKKLEGLDFGHDLQSVKERLDEQKVEHRSIDQFQTKVDQCDRQKQQFKGEEYEVYTRMLNRLHKGYSELLVMSNKRLSDLDTLLDFVQSAANELKWLADKEEVEVTRDWSAKNINLVEVEQYHRQLISDMERREHQFNVVQDRGESLIRQRHPATKCIEGLMARMQSQWSWLLQLINCLETHSKNAADYHQFYNEARECDQWITKTEDKLNTTYSKQNFSIEEGEQLLKEMVRLKEDITRFGSVVSDLVSKSKDVVPLKQRKAALPRPVKARSVCLIKQANTTITKNETVTLHDNSQRSKWRVTTSSGSEVNAPGVCFVIPPPDQEAIDTANELKKRYEALVLLWAKKQHKLRQNMIFATLKIVKGWDYPTYCAMDPNQRDSIIRALEDDIDKLCREGPPDDPGSKRLRDEMDALRKKFAEFDARRRAEDEEKSNKALTKKYTDAADNLLEKLIEKEKLLVQRCQNPIPRDRDTLESLVIEHKEWEIDVKSYESEIQRVKELFHNIPQKTHTVQRNYDEILETWNRIWSLSQLYIERLKAVETVLLDIENATQVISKIEVRLASGDEMPADEAALRRVNNELIDSQNDIQRNRKTFDELNSSVSKVRRIVEKTRPKAVTHSDVTRVEDDVKNLFKRWANCESTVIERLRSCEACADLFRTYKKRIDSDRSWLSQIIAKVNTLLARPDLDSTAKIYESLVERKSSIEDTNSAGGRFIREAKIYDLKIKSFRESLEDSHPSLDASAKMSRRTPGADIVAEELDQLNKEYSELLDAVSKLLNQVKDDTKLQEKMAAILAWIQEMESRLNRYRVLSVYVEQLREQVAELSDMAEEIHSHESEVADIVRSAQEIIRHSSGGDSFFIKDKLDALQSRFSELTHKTSEKLNQAKEALPIAQKFHSDHNQLNQWMDEAEREIKNLGSMNLNAQEKAIKKLESQIPDNRNLLESINHLGPKLSVISPGQGAATIEGFVTRASRRFYAICEQIQRKAERTQLLKQRINEVITDIDELLDWFRDAERQLLEAEPITPNPEALAILLKETKALYDDINSQKGRVRDVITNAKKSMRESSDEDLAHIRDKAEELKELANHVSQLCQDRLNALEQALPLAQHFFEAHSELSQWFDEAESEAQMLSKPAIHAPQIRRQQEATKALLQSVAEHKPLIDKLNKTGTALMRLIFEDDARQIQKIMDSDNDRYNQLRNFLREQQNALEAALQATSQFVDKLDGMLNSLNNTADQLRNAEPIAAHPDRIQEQIFDNNAIINDLEQRADAVAAIKSAARDVISKAGKSDEPAIRDIKNKLNKLNDLWDEVQKNSKSRGRSLDDALKVAEKFWNELNNVMKAIRDLQDTLNSQEPPAAEPNEIKQQQNQLKEIKHDMDQTKPEVERTKQTGRSLMQLCGEPDKPEVKKHIEDLDNAWDNVTSLYAKREQNLIDAMEKAMNFHEMLKNLLDFLGKAERKFDGMGPIAADIDAVKKQIRDLKEFQNEVNPYMVEVEALNRQAHELLEDVSPDQARSIRGPVDEINRRWDSLLKNIVERQSDLDNALLRLGQFQHALNEFLAWITKTERTLDDMRPVFGDPPVIEVELAKHKVLMNDIQAHQTSLDTLNIAGKQMMASERGTESARATQSKLNDLNSRWEQLLDKAHQRQKELEEALREAQAFNQEIQDLLIWLNDVDQQLSSSKPVGGLPETAREQLNRFMELFAELESARPKVESTLKQGEELLRRSTEGAATNLQHNLKTLRQRWENVLSRANDRKIKLEIALREATEFHEALQEFVDWLTSSEKYLSNLQPVSRVVDNVLQQIEEHKHFQKDIGAHRETMLNLDKKGTHLKYFSQKQDVILIKNLLVSVQHRWERVVSKAAERTRALDHGYKEAKEFNDAWSDLISWLNDAEKTLDSIQQMGNNPEFIKQMLSRHKEFQRSLGAKQSTYDSTIKFGRTLKEKAPKPDIPILQEMLDELKNKWNSVCNKSVDRQRKLEEALLYSGQFKDAIQALIDWLDKAKRELAIDQPVHGDLDTVTALVDQHKAFQEDFKSRAKNLQSVRKTASDLLQTATSEDARHIKEQMNILDSKWDEVSRLSDLKKEKLEEALKLAEQLHKSVHMLLEWLSDAEMKLRFAGPLPEDEATTRQQIAEHERFMREMSAQEKNKDSTISLAQEILQKCHPDATPVIRHWITIIQSRWEEVSAWAQQREQRLQDHLRSLRNIMDLLEELMAWLIGAEASLLAAEALPLPDDVLSLERLIEEHQRFIDDMIRREPDVEKVAKAFSTKRTVREQVSRGIEKGRTRGLPPRTSTPTRGHFEPEIKHPRARELLEKWRVVWKLAMDRMKRLQDKLNYNRELDRMRHFDFDEWRRRFLGWMNNKKARIMDFFRNIDTDNDGKVTKSEFIEGFLASKFPTTRLEMDRVADIFDRNNDGYIDQKEYLDTLRPDRDQPKTEAEIIQDEVQRLVNKCTCLVRYKVFQVGEGRYRFGESQKLRLVRILRSTVMVRVGGGWVSLDEFLVKNDPCRAKGRTNVELREQFILADGVSQSMTPFKSKSPIKSDGTINTTGPITKIREKSERSVPMTHQHQYRYGNSTSDYSFSDQHDSSGASKGRPRSRLTIGSGSKPNSTPGSRHSSRPASRASSDMSVESLEGYQQRRTTSTTRSKLSFSTTPSRTNGTNGTFGTRERWK